MKVPSAERPSLSGYVESGKLLPWQWVDARMEAARNYWITTVGEGFPSSRPVWGVWKSPTLWFSTGSAIAKRVAKDARVQVNLESADELVIIEGLADLAPPGAEYRQRAGARKPEPQIERPDTESKQPARKDQQLCVRQLERVDDAFRGSTHQ